MSTPRSNSDGSAPPDDATASSSSNKSAPPYGNWALFLRQRRLMAQLQRLQNDFKHCYCPAGCNGGLHADQGVAPAGQGPPQPTQPVHAPFVRVDSDLPRTWARPHVLRGEDSKVIAESRGTSDILLHRDRARATLRMSLQVRSDPSESTRVGYFGEMFLTRWGHEEEFIGFIQSWLVDRRSNEDWEDLYLSDWAIQSYGGFEMTGTMDFLQRLFDIRFYGDKDPYEYWNPEAVADEKRTENAMLLPAQKYREHFAAAWAGISDDTTDILYIPMVQGQRIVSQGFELFFRLLTGGTLPAAHHITRPLSVLLEAGPLGRPWAGDWRDSSGNTMTFVPQVNGIARGYARCGFMRLVDEEARPDSVDFFMGRSVHPAEYPAAPGDMGMWPPNPPDSDESTPSPTRELRGRGGNKYLPGTTTPVSPTRWRGRNVDDDDGRDDEGGGGDDDDDEQPGQGSSAAATTASSRAGQWS